MSCLFPRFCIIIIIYFATPRGARRFLHVTCVRSRNFKLFFLCFALDVFPRCGCTGVFCIRSIRLCIEYLDDLKTLKLTMDNWRFVAFLIIRFRDFLWSWNTTTGVLILSGHLIHLPIYGLICHQFPVMLQMYTFLETFDRTGICYESIQVFMPSKREEEYTRAKTLALVWLETLLRSQRLSCALIEFEPAQLKFLECHSLSSWWKLLCRAPHLSYHLQLSATRIHVWQPWIPAVRFSRSRQDRPESGTQGNVALKKAGPILTAVKRKK